MVALTSPGTEPVMRNNKPITVGELITILAGLPPESVLKVRRYADDFAINQDTRVNHLSGVGSDGFVEFGFTDMDYSIDDWADDEWVDEDGVDVVERADDMGTNVPKPTGESSLLADWEKELLGLH